MAKGEFHTLVQGFTATADLVRGQPVSVSGGAAAAGAYAIGFAAMDTLTGDRVPVVLGGIVVAIAGGAIDQGDEVEVHSTVTQVVAKDAGISIGRALHAASSGHQVQVRVNQG